MLIRLSGLRRLPSLVLLLLLLTFASSMGCLTASGDAGQSQSLSLEVCGHNLPSQIWSLPN